MNGDDGQEDEESPLQKAGKEWKPLLCSECSEEKCEAQEGERCVPIHYADGHIARKDDLTHIDVEDKEQQGIDGEEEIEEQFLHGGRVFIVLTCSWECTEKCAQSPDTVCHQSCEEIGCLRQPAVGIGDDQRPECCNAEHQSEKEQDTCRDGKNRSKEQSGKSRRTVCTLKKKERKKTQCEIYAERPRDQMTARRFDAIPKICEYQE